MRVAVYIRVSTDEQASSAEAQESGALAWCAAQGHEVVATYRDIGHSGAEWVRRRGIIELQVDASRTPRPWDILVTRDLDRLGRDQAKLAGLLALLADHDAQVVEWSTGRPVELDTMGRMFAGMRAAMAELEREMIAHRTRTALRQKAERGLCAGGGAYGYRHRRDPDGVREVIDDAEAAVVREVYQRAAAGESMRAIARDLNARGVPPPRSRTGGAGRGGLPALGTWGQSTLWKIVRNPRFKGRIVWGALGARYKGGTRHTVDRTDTVERDDPSLAIVDDATWERAQVDSTAARAAAGRAPKRGAPAKYLLVGLAVCDGCDGPIGSARTVYQGGPVAAYCCLRRRDRGGAACAATFCRRAALLDAIVIDWLVGEVLDDDLIAGALADARRLATEAPPDPRIEQLRAEERDHATAVSRLTVAVEAGAGEVGELVARLTARSRQLADVRGELGRVVSAGAVVPLDLEARVRAVARDAGRGIVADPAKARAVLDLVLVGRVRVSQPVARGPVWVSAEAAPGALLRQSDAGYVDDSNGSRSYPVGPTVRLHRQVA